MYEPDAVEQARATAAEFKRLFGHYPPVELGNCAVYAGQGEGYRRWELACIAAGRELDWRDFINLPVPDANDPSPTARLQRQLFELFPHYTYNWHLVAKFFCDHFCSDAFEDWMRACVTQKQDLDAADFLREPSPEVMQELEEWEQADRPDAEARASPLASLEDARARIAAAFGGSPDGAPVAPKKPTG